MTMGAPLGISITGDSREAEQALARVEQRVDRVTAKTKQAVLVQRDLNRETSASLRSGAQAATALRAGGAGAGLGAAAGGVAAGGVMGNLAAVAGLAATVVAVTQRFVALADASAKRRLDFELQLADAAEKAKDARAASAERGQGQEQAYRRALFTGGRQAIRRADALIEAGIDPATAYAAAADTHAAAGQHGNTDQVLLQIARRGGDVGTAARTLRDRPWMAGSASAATDLMGLRASDYWSDWSRGDAAVEGDPFLRRAEARRRQRGELALADRDNATTGAHLAGGARDVRMATDPAAELRRDAIVGSDKALAELARAAELQSRTSQLLADIFSPGGSFETQLIRAMRDRNHVLINDP